MPSREAPAASMPEVADAEQLYGLRPEEFTAARDGLARRLRAAKQRDEAEAVKKLRRPSPVAWALNQAARGDARLIESALGAGAALRQAMSDADGRRIREAERSTRQASDAVVDAAARVLADSGGAVTDDTRSRMAATVRAAIVDPDVAGRLRTGTLDRDVELAGLGVDDMVVPATKPKPKPSPTRPPKHDQATSDQQQAEREERRRREEARRAARARAAELDAEADRLARRAERLATAADRAEQSAREARAEAEEARSEADQAAGRAAAARAELDEA